VLGKPADRLVKRVKGVRELLGDHQDAVVGGPVLREIGMVAHIEGENGFTYGVMHAAERARASEARRAYPRALRKASTAKARRWTR